MKTIYLLVLMLVLSACSVSQLEQSIDKGMIAISGNKPPASFVIANVETMRDYVFNTKDFSFSLPSAKQSDFTIMGGWNGMSMRDGKTIVLGFKGSIVYHIELTFDTYNYKERERATEYRDYKYLQNKYGYVKKKQGKEFNVNVHYSTYGRENYSCLVRESRDNKNAIKKIAYHCFKYNSKRTKAKKVLVRLTYHKPTNPTLAKQYTYEDLKDRAKRMLDNLYIKDEW